MRIIDLDQNTVIKTMREGVDSEFWRIIKQSVDESLEVLEQHFLDDLKDLGNLSAEECRLNVNLYNAKKKYLEKLKEMPRDIINSFNSPDQTDPNMDPYHQTKDFLPDSKM